MSEDTLLQRTQTTAAKRKYTPQVINAEQIAMAKEIIKEMYPLVNTPITRVFPAIGFVMKPCLKEKDNSNECEPLIEGEEEGHKHKHHHHHNKKKGFELTEEQKSDPLN